MKHLDFTNTMIVGSDEETNYTVEPIDDDMFAVLSGECEHCSGRAEYVILPPMLTHGEPFVVCQEYMLNKATSHMDPDTMLLLEGGTPVEILGA